ncbi:MAG: hypothetical protein KKA42_14725, partial [candidate division Zixibacteria bacterium]|nr:hypothetical protein [candidate division Zixibacteria bacterium]
MLAIAIRNFSLLALMLLTVLFAPVAALADCFADEEYEEALKATEDEWKAVTQTMDEASAKFKEFREKYQEYEDMFFSQDMERSIMLASELFGFDPKDEVTARRYLKDIREGFNSIDRAGLKSKLDFASDALGKAGGYAKEMQNAFDFAKKYDPANAKENPTYGLRLIGTTLTESAGKLKAIPLVGDILGRWVEAYGEVAADFANALDRMDKKIKSFRQENLCGQLGHNVDAQQAFENAAAASNAYDGQPCASFFPSGALPRMRGGAYEGNGVYFLYSPVGCRGYFSQVGATDKVYGWHKLLINTRALDPDWLANRANSLQPAVESRAREYYRLFDGWYNKSHKGWVIIEAIRMWHQCEYYGALSEEEFVANYVLDEKHRSNMDEVVDEYRKHTYVSGNIFAEDGSGKKPVGNATIDIRLDGGSFSTTSGSNGAYELLMKAKPGPVSGQVSASGYDDTPIDGRIPENVLLGWDFTLGSEAVTCVISGTVSLKAANGAIEPAGGAAVSATGVVASVAGAGVTGGDGSYQVTVTGPENTAVSVTATLGDASGSASATLTGDGQQGVDITMSADGEEEAAAEWTISVDVKDADGKPLPGATVSGGPLAVTTSGAGTAVVGPITVTNHTEENPFTVTLAASIQNQDGTTSSGASVTLQYAGQAVSSASLVIGVQTAVDVTVSGYVRDINGIGLQGATVTGGTVSTTTAASGAFTLPSMPLFAGDVVNVSAVFTDGTNSYAGGPVAVTFDGTGTALGGVEIALNLSQLQDVTISGRVMDANGKPIGSATISGGGQSTVSDAAGSYTLPPFQHELGTPVTVSAVATVFDGSTVAGQAATTPTSHTVGGVVITISIEEATAAVISGLVVDQDGTPVSGATVSAGGVSTATDGSGGFSLPPCPHDDGAPIPVSASATKADGSSASGQTSATPNAEGLASVTITIDLSVDEDEDDGEGDDIDDLIDELEDELGGGGNYDALVAEFYLLISNLDGIAGDFYGYADFFDQRMRELREASCQSADIGYALSAAETQIMLYDAALGQVPGLYADLLAASPENPDAGDFMSVEGELSRVVSQADAMQGRYDAGVGQYGMYKCDDDASDVDAGNAADPDADPDDVETGAAGGGGVEVCDDGIDNDGDNEIDECDAGCCDKSVQITVTDCGTAADDIFQISIDGATI